MTDYFLIVLAVLSSTTQRALQKIFIKGERHGGVWFFNLIMCSASFALFAVCFVVDFQFNPVTLLYSAVFAVCFTCATVFIFLAIKTGPLALSSLIVSFALVIPMLWGFIFWGSRGNAFIYAGFVAAAASLCLININFKKKDGGRPPEKAKNKVSVKWLCYVSASFLSNGFAVTVQRIHQNAFPGKFRAEFMLFAMLLAALFCLIFFLKNGRGAEKKYKMGELVLPASAGIANGLFNFLLIILATSSIGPAVLYPLIAAGAGIATYVMSVILFKERFTVSQNIGVAAGIAAIILLNL